jgi:antitoxin component HigA of HigAB toxin-antitoxin module
MSNFIPQTLPTNTPAETLNISPEQLEVSNCYLQNPDIKKVAEILDMPVELVSQILDRKEVRAYINSIFFSVGFNNRFQMQELMDTIIKKKLKDMDEADIGSTKDITEILALKHKMTIELLDKEIELEKIRASNQLKSQVNVQINEGLGSSKYSALISQLINGSVNAND